MAASSQQNAFPPGYLEEYCGYQLIAANTAILVIATVLLGLRVYARKLTTASAGWDDFLLLPAWVLLVALGAIIYLAISEGGTGRHVQAVVAQDPQKLVTLARLIYVSFWFYVPSGALSRVSVVVLYLRIFTNKFVRFSCWAVIAFLTLQCIAIIIAAQVECTPLAYTWDKSIQGGRCFDLMSWYKAANILNVVGDIAILALPIHTIWTLNVSTKTKLGIALVCLTGSVGLIASCVRTSEFFISASSYFPDPTWVGSPLLVWTAVECGMYFFAACLIGLRPVFLQVPKLVKNQTTSRYASRRFGLSDLGSHPRGLPTDYGQIGTSKRAGSIDMDSLSRIVSTGHGNEVETTKDYHESNGRALESSLEAGHIRVDTEIEVSSEWGDMARKQQDVFGIKP